jgi:eukaryotic-like serine/threonine-protein kinase
MNPLSEGVVLKDTYRVLRRLGGGGMGEVYEAEHTRLNGRYAIKRLLPESGSDPSAFRRFQREAEIASSLQHPNIVQVIDFDLLQDGSPYLVMEMLKGRDLDETLQACGKLAPQRAANIVEQTAAGLSAAHDNGIVHRDLKPANIFIVPLPGGERELVKLVDFGISKILAAKTKLTADASLIGTPQYMSPEQASGLAVGPETDQFALALIAREMLTGAPTFNGDSFAVLLYKIVHENPPTLAEIGFRAHPDVEAALVRAMSKRPTDRFPSVSEFAKAFRQGVDAWLLGETVAVGSVPPGEGAFDQTFPSAVPLGRPVSFPQPVAALSEDVPTSPSKNSAVEEPFSVPISKPRWAVIGAVFIVVVAALVAGVASWRGSKSTPVVTANEGAIAPSIGAPSASITPSSSIPAAVATASAPTSAPSVAPEVKALAVPSTSGPNVAIRSAARRLPGPSAPGVSRTLPPAAERDVAPPNPYLMKKDK